MSWEMNILGSAMNNCVLLEELLIKKSQQKRRTSPSNFKVRFFVLTKSKLAYYEHRHGVRQSFSLREGWNVFNGRKDANGGKDDLCYILLTFLVLATAPCTENWSNGWFRASDQWSFGVNGGRFIEIFQFIERIWFYCINFAWAVCKSCVSLCLAPHMGTGRIVKVTSVPWLCLWKSNPHIFTLILFFGASGWWLVGDPSRILK